MNKKCTSCSEVKDFSCFHKQSRSSDGFRELCKDCRKIKYLQNSEYIKEKARVNYVNNSDNIKKYQKKYKINNIEKVNKRERDYKRNRRLLDNTYKLRENISCLIRNSLKNHNHKKTSKTSDILGLSVCEFKEYLNNNKYKFKYTDESMDIDHIIPISSAKTQEEALSLNHYTNFQLLPRKYNRCIKRGFVFDVSHFELWLKQNKNM